MRKSVLALVCVTLAVLAVACGNGGNGSLSVDTNHARPEMLYVGSQSTLTALTPKSGRIRFQETSAMPSRDWSVLYSTTNEGLTTVLHTLDPATGEERAQRTLPGAFTLRVVSEDGSMVALTPPGSTDTYHPVGKDPSRIVVVRRDDPHLQVLDVPGNVEPEAFSLSGDALFVIDFLPPLAPERYRVARLDLTRGSVDDVRSKEQELQEPMRGTARAQAMAPDGRRLYTLYKRDATADEPAEAFVHVLDLDAETATCVDLPTEFADDPLGAVTVSPSGDRLYVVSPNIGKLAELDLQSMTVARTGTVAPPAASGATTVRATATATTLYVAVDDRIAPVALDDLTVGAWTTAPGSIIGIEPATDDATLYVVLVDRVLVFDPRTFVARREVDLPPTTTPIDHVAPALPPISPGYTKCAC
jgi:hypothetical protein